MATQLFVDGNGMVAPVPAIDRLSGGETFDASTTTFKQLPKGGLVRIYNKSDTTIDFALENTSTTPRNTRFVGFIPGRSFIDLGVQRDEDMAYIHFSGAGAGDLLGFLVF
ncbi:MAG: hypothetical protein ACR2N8_02985 [Parvibaculales bacterium]